MLNGFIVYDIVEGPVDTERFVKFLKEHVVHSRYLLLAFGVIDALH